MPPIRPAPLTPRERALRAFRHVEPDRTPFFEKLIKSPHSDRLLGRPCLATNFLKRMELMEAGDWETIVEGEARDLVDLAQILEMDLLCVGRNLKRDFFRPVRLDEYSWRTEDNVMRYFPGSPWIEETPLVEQTPEQEEQQDERDILDEWEPPDIGEDEFYVLRRVKQLLRERGVDIALFAMNYTMGIAWLPPHILQWFGTRPDLIERYFQKQSDTAIAQGRLLAREGTDIVALGGDLAADSGPMISPRHYARFVAPRMREQAAALHSEGVFVTTGSDGNLWPLIDDLLLTTGVDGYEEIDGPAGMDLAKLKARFGERICFIGNMDIRFTLCLGSSADVERATVECIEKGWGNGGHVLMTSNCVHEGVRFENFVAMVNAYRRYFGLTPLTGLL